MSKFKVGDKVYRVSTSSGHFESWHGIVGEVYTVRSVSVDGLLLDGLSGSCTAECFELAWLPTPGEMIEVLHAGKGWVEREFVMMLNGMYLVEYLHMKLGEDQSYFVTNEARPIPIDTTITFSDGKTIELSKDSYNTMHKGAK